MRRPSSGRSRSNRSRIRRRTGISRSAHSIRRTPSAARPRSVTSWAGDVAGGGHRGSVSLRWKRRRSGPARSGHGRPEPVDEPLLEAEVLHVAEPAIGVERRRIVRPDVEHDLVAGPQQLGGHGAGDGRREATTTVVDVGQDVADDGQPRGRADDVGPGRGDQLAVDAQAVVDAVGDRAGRQPRGEAELVEPVQLPDLDRQEPLDGGRVRLEAAPGRPTSGPSTGPGPPGTRSRSRAGPAPAPRRRRPAAGSGRAGRPRCRPRDPSRTAAAASGRCTRGRARSARRRPRPRPSASARTRAPRGRRSRRRRTAGRARGTRAGGPCRSSRGRRSRRDGRRATAAISPAASAQRSRRPARVGGCSAGGAAGGAGTPGIAAQRARAASDASRSPVSYGVETIPSSVTIPVMSSAGVTSKAGLRTSVPSGAVRTPRNSRTSSGLRSSIGMAEPSGVARSTELVGAQT